MTVEKQPKLLLTNFVSNQVWVKEYPVKYAGCCFSGRMTVIKMTNGQVWIHSPCSFDDDSGEQLKKEIEETVGDVVYIIAPGTYHYFHVQSCQKAFPNAKTYICPGIEKKRPDIEYDGMLSDIPLEEWSDDFDQVLIKGNRLIWEVAFLHKPSKTLVLVDLIEYIGDKTEGTDWVLRFWWKYVMCMWNKPKPAPEYQMGWMRRQRNETRDCLNKILSDEWDFDKLIIAHGDLVEHDAKAVARTAWKNLLK